MRNIPQVRAFDRRLFFAAAVLFPLIVFAGFARTYYLRVLFDGPPIPSSVVHVHGLLMTLWVMLFGTQVWLISSRQVRLHQKLGYGGVILGVLIVVTGVVTALRATKYGSPSAPPDIPPLSFLLVPITDLVMFVVFFGAAIWWRRRPAVHKRLMLLTAINFVPPAIARIPSETLQGLGPLWFFGFPTALLVLVLWVDTRRNGLNWIFLGGAVLLVVSYVARLALMTTGAWLAIATWLTSFV